MTCLEWVRPSHLTDETLGGRGSKAHQVHTAGEPGLEVQVTDFQAGDGAHHSPATTDGTAHYELDSDF